MKAHDERPINHELTISFERPVTEWPGEFAMQYAAGPLMRVTVEGPVDEVKPFGDAVAAVAREGRK